MASSTPTYTIEAARQARQAGAPWKVRIEWVGRNEKNVCGWSNKYWEAEGIGNGPVTTRWGKIGHLLGSQTKGFDFVEKKLRSRLGGKSGYRYHWTSVEVFAETPAYTTKAKRGPAPLTGPFALITALKAIRNGFAALDIRGFVLFELPPSGGFALRETYNIPMAN